MRKMISDTRSSCRALSAAMLLVLSLLSGCASNPPAPPVVIACPALPPPPASAMVPPRTDFLEMLQDVISGRDSKQLVK